jgi:hypothetical protein
MANNIALTLTIDGVQQTITTINQLETAIKTAKEQLANLEIGSVEFKNLSTQIRQADSALQNLNENIAGKKLAENIERYAKIGSAITGSFAAAQAAISLFGNESEEITRAAAQAQNLLTIALVGREVAEGAVAASTLIADLATKAQTASTLAADSATKRFYATLAANPYTALLVGVGLLVAALLSFGKASDEAAKKDKEFKDGLNKDIAKEITQLNLLVNQVNNTSLSLNTRKKALDDLQKQFPAYFENLNKEDILTGKVKIATETLTGAIIKQAQARALQGRIEERAVKLLDLEEKILKATKDRQAAEEQARQGGTGITGGGSVGGLSGAQVAEAGATNRLARATSELNELKRQKAEIDKQNIADTQRINSLTVETDTVIGNGTDTLDDNTKAQEKALKVLQDRLELQNELLKRTELLNETEKKVNLDFLEDIKKQIESIKELKQSREDLLKTEKDALLESLKTITTTVQSFGKVPFVDPFGFIKVGDLAKTIKTNLTEIDKNIKDFQIEFILKKLSKDGQDAIQEYTVRLNKAAEQFGKQLKIGDRLIQIAKPDEVKAKLTQFTDEVVRIFNDPSILPGLRETEIEKVIGQIFNLPKKTLSDFKSFGEGAEEAFQKYNEGIRIVKDSLIGFGIAQQSQVKDFSNAVVEYKKLSDELLKISSEVADSTKLISGETIFTPLTGEQIDTFNKQIIEKIKQTPELLSVLLNDIATQQDVYFGRLGKDGVQKLLDGISESFNEIENLSKEQLTELLKIFEDGSSMIYKSFEKNLSPEEFEKLVSKIKKKLAEIPSEADKEFQKSLEKIQTFIQQFQGVLNQLGQLTSEYFSFQLDKVDKRYEDSLSKIQGDTEEANEKRIEAEEIYQRQRKEIEKKAARTSLGISLVQAVANTAEAVTKALTAGPVSGQILAGITAALGAVQVGLISAQISQLNNYRRGGIIKGQGGMVVGPSHEYGGVRFAAGGGVELEGGEAVINRMGSLRYSSLLNSINTSTGGKPINVSNFDDSRIVEAIAKQRSEPIRAFVVESDITNRQNVSKRLDQLSRI